MLTVMDGGRSRAAEWAVCQNETCGKGFLRRADAYGKKRPRIYCSKECSHAARQDRVELQCPVCTGSFWLPKGRVGTTKSGINLCSKACKDRAAKLDGGIEAVWPEFYGKGKTHNSVEWKEKYDRKIKEGCVDCGRKQPYMLTVHHMDGDNAHDEDDNLETVCWNHHMMRHLRLANGEWRHHMRSLTPREALPELLELDRQQSSGSVV